MQEIKIDERRTDEYGITWTRRPDRNRVVISGNKTGIGFVGIVIHSAAGGYWEASVTHEPNFTKKCKTLLEGIQYIQNYGNADAAKEWEIFLAS